MRFSHSSLFGLTTLVATSFLHGANSAPSFHNTASLSRDSLPLTNDVNSFTKMSLAGRDMNNDILHHELNKRDKKNKKHKKKSKNHKKKKTKKSKTKTKAKSSTKKSTTSKASSSSKSSSGSGSYEFSGDGTYYNTGLGSCGITSKDTDLIAALNAPQMKNGENPNNNPICGKKANVKGPKGTVTVTIVDTCPPCKSGDLDLSPSAFGKIADFADGRVNIEWSWA